MKLNNKIVHLWVNHNRKDAWTIAIGDDIWGWGVYEDSPKGYAGSLKENGWQSLAEYMKWAATSKGHQYIGYRITSDDEIPEKLIDWLKEHVNEEI